MCPYLLAVLCLLHLAYMVGDLNQPDGILMIHVGAQEIHLLAVLLDLSVQLIHLPLKAWGGAAWGREAVNRADVWDFLQRTFPGDPPKTQLPLTNGLGSGLRCWDQGWGVCPRVRGEN